MTSRKPGQSPGIWDSEIHKDNGYKMDRETQRKKLAAESRMHALRWGEAERKGE